MSEPIQSIQIKRDSHPDFCRRVDVESVRRGDRSSAKTLRDLANERLLQLEYERRDQRPRRRQAVPA